MTSKRKAVLPPVADWQAASLRFTGFLAPSAEVAADTWWTDVVGEEPETRTVKPKTGEQRAEGPFQNGQMTLSVSPGRIDWLLNPKPPAEPEESFFKAVGLFVEASEPFVELVQKWFGVATCPQLQRIAFGAVLLQPAENKIAAYREIDLYLPSVTLDSEHSSQFSYQINRPRPSDVHDVQVNRLCKWSVATMGFTTIMPAGEQPKIFPSPQVFHACRLELDINTDQSFDGEFTPDQGRKIFRELMELGTEIASEGDQP